MKMNNKIALTFIAGAMIGGTTIEAIHAQAKLPAYAIVDIGAITDPEGYKAISQRPNADMPLEGGRYLARTDKITALDGTPPRRVSIIVFDSPEKAQAWYNSPEMKKISAIREKTTQARVFLVEGLPSL